MDRKTLLAVVLSVVVLIVGFSLQSLLTPESTTQQETATSDATQPATAGTSGAVTDTTGAADNAVPVVTDTQTTEVPTGAVLPVPQEGIAETQRVYNNGQIAVTFSPVGGTIISYQLLQHLDGDSPVDMVWRGDNSQRAFTLHFGDYTAPPVEALFNYRQVDSNTFEFYRDFYVVGNEDEPFTITKRYRFVPGEYMFALEIEIRNHANRQIPLNFNGLAYTIGYGPQMGPTFERLDQRTEFRKYMIYDNGKRRDQRNLPAVITERISWAAIAGKYFAVIAVTDNRDLTTVLAQDDRAGLPVGSQLYISQPTTPASVTQETYEFYLGPKTAASLDIYDNASDNAFGQSGLHLGQVQERRLLFGWLENILKWVLQLIVRVIPNYGLAIIVLTILVKLLLWPLTRKSYESNARMQAVQPKLQEIREKYGDDKAKANEAMAKLYREEKVNPLGGCLPMLVQFPFFLAMYGLFNNHFDLRGAVFIPGWINDLSAPDVIVSFGNFTIPLLGWDALRGLPFIFLATQFISSKLMQSASTAQTSGQMKLMQYGLPAMFFFILYNVPSGLLVYWICSNVLTAVQQYWYNKHNRPQVEPPKSTFGKKRR